MSRFHDFDAAWAESEGEPLTIGVMGEVLTLSPKLPAKVGIMCIRAYAAGVENINPKDTIEMAQALFGRENLDRLLDTGISMDRLQELMTDVMALYQGDDPNPQTPAITGEEKESPGVTSSSTGARSKPTGKGSTK